jgi:signal transduction histidine kinase
MKKQLHNLLIAPKQPDQDWQNKEVILNALLLSTVGLLAILLAANISSYVQTGIRVTGQRIFSTTAFLLLALALYALARKGRTELAARLLVLAYVAIVVIIFAWVGIDSPLGILLAGFLIPLAGMLLGARYALAMVFLNIGLLIVIRNGPSRALGMIVLSNIVMSTMYAMIGVISWLSIRQVQQSQARAVRYQAELKQERDSLEIKVKQRTKELWEAQLEKLQQTHRFAELGYISTALMHDLVNRLTVVSIDLATVEKQTNGKALDRAKQNISYIEDAVHRTRHHLRGEKLVATFSLYDEVAQLVKALRHNRERDVTITLLAPRSKKDLFITGNVTGFRQIINGLIINAIESYADMSDGRQKRVVVRLLMEGKHATITVSDKGKGISRSQLKTVFQPFYSTKGNNMGMGLFIAKQLTEQDFKGTIRVTSSKKNGTMFTLKVPVQAGSIER